MAKETCPHVWAMTHVVPGFIVTEKCSLTGQIVTYMSFEASPPLQQWRDGEHLWNVIETAQSIRFDLVCATCGREVPYDELLGLMLCTGCDEACRVNRLQRQLAPQRTWVYVAYGYRPVEEKKQLTPEKIAILETYFNQRRQSARSQIRIVSHELVSDIGKCYAEVIKDVELTDLQTG